MPNICCWGKKDYKYSQTEFAKLITKYSKTQVIIIQNFKEIEKFLKFNK